MHQPRPGESCSSFEARARDQIARRLSATQQKTLLEIRHSREKIFPRQHTVDQLSRFGLIARVEWSWSDYACTPRGAWVCDRLES